MVIADNSISVLYNAIQSNEQIVASSYLAASVNWGMTILLMAAVFAGLFGFFYFWNQKKRQENINQTADKALVAFGMKNGHIKFVLCEEHKGEIQVDDKKGNKKLFDGSIKAPTGLGNIENYYILEDHGYIVDYPFGKPPAQQTQIMLYHFNENDPTPKFPRHPEQWNTDKYAKLTSRLIELSKEETNLQALVAEVSGAFRPLLSAAKMIALIPQLRLLIFIVLGALVIVGFISYMNMGGINTVKQFLLGMPTK